MNKPIEVGFLIKKNKNNKNSNRKKKKEDDQRNYYYLWHLVATNILQIRESKVESKVESKGDAANAATIRDDPCPEIERTVWDEIWAVGKPKMAPASVALIDVGVSREHPNLSSRIDVDKSIDLTVGRAVRQYSDGTAQEDFPGPGSQRRLNFPDENAISEMWGKLDLEPGYGDLFSGAVNYVALPDASLQGLTHGDETFSSHGTSVAGLIVGEPAVVSKNGGGKGRNARADMLAPEKAFADAKAGVPKRNPNSELLPYFGADPFSKLISIKTSFEDDPLQFIAAFAYAWHNKVDVIALPRGIPDPLRKHLSPTGRLKAELEKWDARRRADLFARLADVRPAEGPQGPEVGVQDGHSETGLVDQIIDRFTDKVVDRVDDRVDDTIDDALDSRRPDPYQPAHGFTDNKLWKILKHLIIAVSKEIPVICAAGNDGESQLIYPANLAAVDNGIVAVGAVTAEGLRSGCSSYGDKLTLVAPSDDCEVFNLHQLRIDEQSPAYNAHDYEPGRGKKYAYSHLDLVTTDLPGAFGYSDSNAFDPYAFSAEDNLGRLGGYFTSFGGTSGASALVAGIAALVQRAHRARKRKSPRLDGIAVKRILIDACNPDAVVYPGTRSLTPDDMNAFGEGDGEEKRFFFGAGLVDAAQAVKIALKNKDK